MDREIDHYEGRSEPIVRRPQQEAGAGPAALSGPVRYPDRKPLWAALSTDSAALRAPAEPHGNRPDIWL